MGMFERYKNKKLAIKVGVPYEIPELWLAGCYAFNHKEAGLKVRMPYFSNRKYVEYERGQVVEVFRKKTGSAYYKILDYKKYPGSDPAMFDDQKEYHLLFHHFKPNEAEVK